MRRLEADGIKHDAGGRAVRAVNEDTVIRARRILFHRAVSVAANCGADKLWNLLARHGQTDGGMKPPIESQHDRN